MIRNPQILGTRAHPLRRVVLVALPVALCIGGCGLKGPLYLPASASAAAAASAPMSPAAPVPAPAPSTPNTLAR